MHIQIARIDDSTIATTCDTRDIRDKEEVAHIICELERMKKKLLPLWEQFD
jgi:hypothetical protein